MPDWAYDKATKTYIDANGRRMSQATLTSVRDAYLSSMADLIESYVNNLASGTWTISTFETEMRNRLKNAYVAEYTLGKGGFEQMTPSDYGRVGAQLKKQYKYLRTYLEDVAAGRESVGNARQRANNFLGSARQAFGRGRAGAWDITLPYYPGDGGTECGGNCKCVWDIEGDDEEVRAYWVMSSSEHCDGCKARNSESSPHVIAREK